MKLNELKRIQDAIEVISEVTNVHYEDIVDELTGTCWSEEDAGDIKFSMIDD